MEFKIAYSLWHFDILIELNMKDSCLNINLQGYSLPKSWLDISSISKNSNNTIKKETLKILSK